VSQQDTNGPTAPAGPAGALKPGHRARPAVGLLSARTAGRSLLPSARPWALDAVVLAGFLAAGAAATWPRASYITGRLPLGADQAQYVWSLWWVARQITHLGNPWFTAYLAAPVGVHLGFDTLMPLVGVVMAPITLAFGPSASYNLLAIVSPGLAAYAMYRAARLWLPGQVGAIAAGAFFGMSGMLASQDWYHIHTAIGCVFLPLTLEASVRLRRGPTARRGLILGLVLGTSMLVDQESAVLAAIIAALALIPWLMRRPGAAGFRALAASAVVAAVIASPQIAAMAQQTMAAGRTGPAHLPASNYVNFAAELPSLFAPSPRLASYGLTGLASIYRAHTPDESLATFGVVLTVLAGLGLIVSWRRPGSWRLALLWLGSAALALGPTLYVGVREYAPLAQTWHGLQVSLVLPYTWLIRMPALSSFREADRLALLGLVGAALLAGAAVNWLRRHAWPLIIVVAVLGALEAGWPSAGQITVPTALPALDRPIAADQSGSIVVDAPFSIRGPQWYGRHLPPFALALATADGHPRGISYSSGVPEQTIAGIRRHAFYAGLVAAPQGKKNTPARLAAARRDLRSLHVGWVLVWTQRWTLAGTRHPGRVKIDYGAILSYLAETGFRFDYQADGVLVYRPSATPGAPGGGTGSQQSRKPLVAPHP
jgi:hypothetical protein